MVVSRITSICPLPVAHLCLRVNPEIASVKRQCTHYVSSSKLCPSEEYHALFNVSICFAMHYSVENQNNKSYLRKIIN